MFDLRAYLDRIGHDGPVGPTLPCLQALVAAHADHVPFENIDVLMERGIRIDLPSVQAKLIDRRRGGYCFEQNTLLRAALDAIGFRTTGLIARVRYGFPPGSDFPRTHMMLRVDLPEGAWLVDVGFGGLTPTAPLAMTVDIEQPTPNEPMRLVQASNALVLQAKLLHGWADVYQFTAEPAPAVDYEMGNWFTSTHPASVFRNNLVATKPRRGGRLVLFNSVFTQRGADGQAQKTTLTDRQAVRDVLADGFGLIVEPHELDGIMAKVDRQGPPAFNPFS